MSKDRTINGLDYSESAKEHKDQILKVAGKMILSSITPVHDAGVILKTFGDDLETKIETKENLEDDVKEAVTDVGTSDDDGIKGYKVAIGVIEANVPTDAAREGLGVVLSKEDEKATICLSPTNCHASHGDPAHSVDAICNTDKNRKYLKARITKGAPDDPTQYIDVDFIKETGKHVLFLLPAAYQNVPLWIILTPYNTFGKGNDSAPFKCDPMS